MKVALVAPPWQPVPPRGYGGIETMVDLLARGLARRGHDVVLCASGDSTCPVRLDAVLPRAVPDQMGRTVPAIVAADASYAAASEVDVVHDHTVLGPFIGVARTPAPIVTTAHWVFEGLTGTVYRRLAEFTHLVAVSHAQRGTVADVAFADVIHHGVDVEVITVGKGDGGYLAFLGRFSPHKGVDLAIETAQRSGFALRIAAREPVGQEQAYFDAVVKPRLSEDVVYVGELDAVAKLELLAGARALLMPVRWDEPFGIVMAESLACGTPVLAMRRGAAVEVVLDGQTGFVCDSVDELVDAVARLDTIDRARCRQDAEERFSADVMVDRHVALYSRVV